MGTFHHDKHALHGTTVVVDTTGAEVYVGRCDDMDEEKIILLDADVHRDGEKGKTKAQYIEQAAQVGVWKQFDRIAVPRSVTTTIRPLGEY
jgi:hypothetical protein